MPLQLPTHQPQWGPSESGDLPTVFLKLLGLIGAVEELPLEELHGHHGKDEHEQHVDNEDVEDILEGIHHTVKHGLTGEVERGCEGLGACRASASSSPQYQSIVIVPILQTRT